jgi:hypothetical protein
MTVIFLKNRNCGKNIGDHCCGTSEVLQECMAARLGEVGVEISTGKAHEVVPGIQGEIPRRGLGCWGSGRVPCVKTMPAQSAIPSRPGGRKGMADDASTWALESTFRLLRFWGADFRRAVDVAVEHGKPDKKRHADQILYTLDVLVKIDQCKNFLHLSY